MLHMMGCSGTEWRVLRGRECALRGAKARGVLAMSFWGVPPLPPELSLLLVRLRYRFAALRTGIRNGRGLGHQLIVQQ